MRAYLLDASREDLDRLSVKLEESGKFTVVGRSVHPLEAMERIKELRPDVLFLDLPLPCLHGMIVVDRVNKEHPDIRIVIVTDTTQYALSAFDQQVADYVLKPAELERLNKTAARLKPGS